LLGYSQIVRYMRVAIQQRCRLAAAGSASF